MADLDLDDIDLDDMDELARLGHGATPAATRDLVAELRRLRAENTALAAALEDIAGMFEAQTMDGLWIAGAECSSHGVVCYMENPDDPGEWCPVCVAEVAWCAWKMGVLT